MQVTSFMKNNFPKTIKEYHSNFYNLLYCIALGNAVRFLSLLLSSICQELLIWLDHMKRKVVFTL